MKDARGLELRPGQLVAVAQREGNVAALRFGKISDVYYDSAKVEIEWEGAPLRPGKSIISIYGQYVSRPRLVVINDKPQTMPGS